MEKVGDQAKMKVRISRQESRLNGKVKKTLSSLSNLQFLIPILETDETNFLSPKDKEPILDENFRQIDVTTFLPRSKNFLRDLQVTL